MEVLLFVSGLLTLIPFVHTVPWGYPQTKPGTDYWPKIFPLYCSGLSQSPIDIIPSAAVKMTPASFELTGFGAKPPRGARITIQNSGLSAQIKLSGDYLMSGGGLPGRQYRAAGIHFHWGSTNDQGSEHTISGRQFPAEMHVVNYDTRFASVGEAAYKVDGLAVLGFFLEIQAADNPKFAPFLTALSKTRYDDTQQEGQEPQGGEDEQAPGEGKGEQTEGGEMDTAGVTEGAGQGEGGEEKDSAQVEEGVEETPSVEESNEQIADETANQAEGEEGNSINLATVFPISNLFPSTDIMQPYFRYRGSLTTPTCNEVVLWTVFKMPVRISQKQLNVFRSLMLNSVGTSPDVPIVNNYRPPQPLNGRVVFHSAGVLRV